MLSWGKINCDCLSFLTVRRSSGKPQPQTPGTAWMLLQGKEVVSSRPANTHLSLQALKNDSLPSSGKYLTLCGKARECEARKGRWRWWNAGIDPHSSMNHYLQSGGLNPPGAMHCHHVPPTLLIDWSDLRTLIRDIYIVMSPCYPSIHLLHVIKGPVMIITVQLTGLTMQLNLLYFISVSKWTF